MNLQTVTITGVDPSVDLNTLLALSRDFPFVEWGVLLSRAAGAHPKYPSHDWVEKICRFALENRMALSGHLCGAWTQRLLGGEWPLEMRRFSFSRLQLNIAKTQEHSLHPEHWMHLLPRSCEIIVQFNHSKPRFDPVALVQTLGKAGYAASVLMDASGGRGIEAAAWPTPPRVSKLGYAGGLRPENLYLNLKQIDLVTGANARPIWIDMESGVRTEDGLYLDMDRVRQCLAIAANFVQPALCVNGH